MARQVELGLDLRAGEPVQWKGHAGKWEVLNVRVSVGGTVSLTLGEPRGTKDSTQQESHARPEHVTPALKGARRPERPAEVYEVEPPKPGKQFQVTRVPTKVTPLRAKRKGRR